MVHIILIADTLQTIHRTRNGVIRREPVQNLGSERRRNRRRRRNWLRSSNEIVLFQGFVNQDPEDDRPEIWLGNILDEYPTLETLLNEVKRRGYKIGALEHSAIIEMMREAGEKPVPSLAERLGLMI
ncbi:hypothetical protein DEA98_29260 (plasmid) [Brucella pseudogrignonensis]|nr:hypothetical protein [Brucella pseudogrignonensis]